MDTVGDPLADVALFAVYTGGFSDVAVTSSIPRRGSAPSRQQRSFSSDTWMGPLANSSGFGWYLASAWFKPAVILEGIHYRNVIGMSAGDESEGVALAVPHAIERGRAALFDNEWPS
jgi:aminoglycoside phosphotransferase (APT) family kinase protein